MKVWKRRAHPAPKDQDMVSYTRAVGLSGALTIVATTFLGQFTQVQVAHDAAGGSTAFVLFAQSLETGLYLVLTAVNVVRRRTIAEHNRRSILVASVAASIGFLAIAIFPSRVTLLVGLLPGGWFAARTVAIRAVVSSRYRGGQHGGRAETRVQAWSYVSLSIVQVVLAVVAATPLGWRVGLAVIGGTVGLQGILLSRYRLLPVFETEDRPGSHRPLRDLLKWRPAMLSLMSLGLGYMAFQLMLAKVDSHLVSLKWSPGSATVIAVIISTTGRVATLRIVKTARVGDRLTRSLRRSVLWLAATAVFALATLPVEGKILGMLLIAVAAFALEGGQNSQNNVLRGYLGSRSLEAVAIVPLVGNLGSYLAVALLSLPWADWTWVVLGLTVIAAAIAVLHMALERSRYVSSGWRPEFPETPRLMLTLTPAGQNLSFAAYAGANPIGSRIVGDGGVVRHSEPWDAAVGTQYWISQWRAVVAWGRVARSATSLVARLRVFASSGSWPRASTEQDEVVLLDHPLRCFTVTDDADGTYRWEVIPGKAVHTKAVLAGRLGRGPFGPPLVATDGRRYGTFRWMGHEGGSWEIVPLVVGGTWTGPGEPYRRDQRGRWLLDPEALDGHETVPALSLAAPFTAGQLEHSSLHH